MQSWCDPSCSPFNVSCSESYYCDCYTGVDARLIVPPVRTALDTDGMAPQTPTGTNLVEVEALQLESARRNLNLAPTLTLADRRKHRLVTESGFHGPTHAILVRAPPWSFHIPRTTPSKTFLVR